MKPSLKNTQAFTLLEILIAISISTLLAALCFKFFFSNAKSLSSFTSTPSIQIHSFAETLTKDLESIYFDPNFPLGLTTDTSSNSELIFQAYINGTPQSITYQVKNGYLFRQSPTSESKILIKNFNINMLIKSHNGSRKWVAYSSKNDSIIYLYFKLTFPNKNGQTQMLERFIFPMINLHNL